MLEIGLWTLAAIWLIGTLFVYRKIGRLLSTDSPAIRFFIAVIVWPFLLLS